MPREFEGARTKKHWIEARRQWRITTIFQDKTQRVRHFDKESTADLYRAERNKELSRLDEVTFERGIRLYEKERMIDARNRGDGAVRAVLETSRRMLEVFRRMKGMRIGALTEKRAKEEYLGKWQADVLLEHGLINRPTLRRKKGVDPAPCKLPCRCPHDGPPLKPDSHRNYLAEAKTFLRWCVEKEFVGTNVLEGVSGKGSRNPGGLGRNKLGTKKELRALYRTCLELAAEGDERAIGVLFALLFGFRASEVATRQCRHVDEETWTIEIDPDAAKTDASDRDNEVPLVLRPILLDLMKGKRADDYLFGEATNGGPHDKDWVTDSLKVICPKARIPVVNAHSLRGAHSDLAKKAGQTAHAICAQLGHTDERTGEKSYTSEMGRRGARRATQATVFEVLEGGKAQAGGTKE
jgi:integrase